MKIAVQTTISSGFTIKPYILSNPNVDIILLNLTISNFINADQSFNVSTFNKIRDAALLCKSKGKQIAVQITFGDFLTKITGVNYCKFIEGHHQDEANAKGIEVPIFFEDKYVSFVERFFTWLKQRIDDSKISDLIAYIKITGINQQTAETRVPDQDMTGGDAFENASVKWLNVGYSNEKTIQVVCSLIDHVCETFPKTICCLAVIGNRNGFPRIDNDRKPCHKKDVPDISKFVIEYGIIKHSNFSPQTTYFDIGVQDFVTNSGSDKIIEQVSKVEYGGLDCPNIQPVIDDAILKGFYALELHENSIRNNPNFIK